MEREEFQVYYQPQVNIQIGKIMSAEALIRWLHPEKGLISPAQFIPSAEATGFIVQLGEWVLQTACRQIQVWQNAGFSGLRVAVNLSARQFHQPNLSSRVAQILAEIGLEPSSLELELTESLMVEDAPSAIATLQQLKKLGVSISIDFRHWVFFFKLSGAIPLRYFKNRPLFYQQYHPWLHKCSDCESYY